MPTWALVLDLLIKTATAAATITLGYFAWKIATRQAQIAGDKLKLDLFDRRYAVYVAINDWINDLQGRVVPDAEYTAHIKKIEPARFVFGIEVNEWLKSLRKKARQMNHARRILTQTSGSQYDDISHEERMKADKLYSELTLELDEELERVDDVVSPYLGFGQTI
ncbi:MAG: hypothetical protein C0483_04810 [Pirellula sp.]|nr:hypothetical protein [Pirellula sp.]